MGRLELIKGNTLLFRSANELLKHNEISEKHGLRLTQREATQLARVRAEELRYHGRLEFGEGIFGKLIEAFCDSPYITSENYFETLCALTEIFYYYKNETEEYLSDSELIDYMERYFNGSCNGSLELLSTREMDELARNLRQ